VQAAESVCKRAAETAASYDSEVRKEVDTRLKEFLQTPEGRQLLDTNVKNALVGVIESTMIHRIMQDYVSHEIGSMARDAVRNAIKNEETKAKRKAKKAASA